MSGHLIRSLTLMAYYAAASGGVTYAQETVNQATIAGRVADAQGAVVPGALVTVRQTDTNVTVEASTDLSGRFRFPYLRIGPYELRVKLTGFRENARSLVLSAGSRSTFRSPSKSPASTPR